MVLHKAPLDGSHLKTWQMNLSCAVCIMNAQCLTFFPIPKKLRYRTRHSTINRSPSCQCLLQQEIQFMSWYFAYAVPTI